MSKLGLPLFDKIKNKVLKKSGVIVMGRVFSPEMLVNFQLFSAGHFAMLGLFVVLLASIIFFRAKIRTSSLTQNLFRWTFLTILVLSEVTFQIWCFRYGVWDPTIHIPVQLCSISTFLAIYFLLKPSAERFEFLYYIALIPPLLAIITPDLLYGFPHYRFSKFFLQHIALPLTVLFYAIVQGYRPTFTAIWKSALLINVLALPIALLNEKIGSNYMFLEGPPITNTPLSWFGDGGWMYILSLAVVTIVVFIVTYLPFVFIRKATITSYSVGIPLIFVNSISDYVLFGEHSPNFC
ncbi:TIGR02206 family membrane protein [Alkalihalobacillus sp. AL-G]|uniref:YwaF family protein n=1 Tax=Alkalihalobacillus sp. AL-G TaxID=2926399 RepID=UPI00272961D0|nr:TIGR02206 family membrane protein [Alkalihalobacillus sp. AL-G]WLD93905.1 TIGR02206 family membrane protein [Alkalihalobacillus sp. AL-G]